LEGFAVGNAGLHEPPFVAPTNRHAVSALNCRIPICLKGGYGVPPSPSQARVCDKAGAGRRDRRDRAERMDGSSV